MAKKVTPYAQNTANGSFTCDPLEYGKLTERVDGLDKKIDELIMAIKDLPTRDWVQKEMLQTQVKKINRTTTTRLAIGTIIVSIVVPLVTLGIQSVIAH